MHRINFNQTHYHEQANVLSPRSYRIATPTKYSKVEISEKPHQNLQYSSRLHAQHSPKIHMVQHQNSNKQYGFSFSPISKEETNKNYKTHAHNQGMQMNTNDPQKQTIGKYSNARIRKTSENNMMFESRLRNQQNANSQSQFFSQNLNIQNNIAQLPQKNQRQRKGSFIFEQNSKNALHSQQGRQKPKRAHRISMIDLKEEEPHADKNQNMRITSNNTVTNTYYNTATANKQTNQKKKGAPAFISGPRSQRVSMDPFDFILQRKFKPNIQNFIIIKELGKGAFGKVVLARQKQSGTICAIKILSKREIMADNMIEQIIRQIKIQMYLSHPNIIKIYGFFDDSSNLYILMEAAIGTHLNDHLNNFTQVSQQQAAKIMYQICSAVKVLHFQNVIHRDLKPQNIMLHQGVIKLGDFGWSVYRNSSMRTTFCGTPIYLCPQLLTGNEYDQSIDIWALGVIFYEILYKNNPFNIQTQEELVNILNSPIQFPEYSSVSSVSKDLIRKCLKKKSSDRININEMINHQFFAKFYVPQDFRRK